MNGLTRVMLFIAGRLAIAVLTVWATTFIVFSSLFLVPGDPLAVLLRGRRPTPELVEQLRAQYGLDDPFIVRYADWLGGLLTGDLGYSIQFQTEVSNLLEARLPITLWLISYAAIIILVVGLSVGAWSAVTRSQATDRSILIATSALSAIPAFVAALVLLLVFSGVLGWFPAFGAGDDTLLSRLEHLTLPAVALALSYIGVIARVTRSSLKQELTADHVVVARSRGLGEGYIFRHHVLRNALNPILSYAGILVAGLLVTSQLVEFAFGVPGMGSLLVESVQSIDFAVVQIVTIVIVLAFVITNTIVDLLAPLINPRLRRRGNR